MSRMKILTAAVATAAIASFAGAPAVSLDDNDSGSGKRNLKAELRGSREVPAISTEARGSLRARISSDGTEIRWRLEYSGLQADVTQAHIHLGDHHTNGGVSVFFCSNLGNGPAGTQACPLREGALTGTFVSANVVGPAGQGIAAGEFEELVKALRSGITYANIHSTQFGGGEIRGQIKAED
jgi:hypothetical protein